MSTFFNLFYLYDPWFFHSWRAAFIIGFIAILITVIKLYRKKLDNFYIPTSSIFAILGLLAISVIPLFVNGTSELGVLAMYTKLLCLFVFGIFIFNLFYQHQNGKSQLVRDLKVGIFIQFGLGIIALSGVQWVIDFTLSTNSSVLFPRFENSEQEYRLYNLTSSAFIQLSTFYVLLLHFLLAYNKKHNTISGWVIFALLTIGLISGRTFLLLSFVSLFIYFKYRYLPQLILFSIILISLAYFLPQNWYVGHALEPLINLMNGGKTVSSSTDTLVQKHLFMPELKQLIMGDGLYYTPTKGYYGGSDSGFVRQVLYGGVAYLIICFIFTCYFVLKVSKAWFNNSWLFTLSTLALFTVIHIKADTYAYPGIMFVLLTFLSLFDTSGKNLILFCKNKEAKNV